MKTLINILLLLLLLAGCTTTTHEKGLTYPDFRYQSSFGKLGDSPKEMLSAENIRWNGQSLWSLDANKSELTRYGFDLSSDSLLRQEAVSLNKDILRALDFAMYDDSTFIIPDYSGDNRLCWVNRQGKLLRKMVESSFMYIA